MRVLFCCLFFLSGAAALTYEVVWQRQMMLVFGASAPATSAVLTAFMAGLALGSALFGRVADRTAHAVRTYATIELGIGLSALLVPLLLDLAGVLYVWVYRAYAPSPAVYNVVRFLLCVPVLVIPTTLMGATVPLMGRILTRTDQSLGSDVGLFYAVNTLGAVAGCALSGYLGIRLIGMTSTSLLAVAVNLVIAVSAWAAGAVRRVGVAPTERAAGARGAQATAPGATRRVLVALAGVSGLCALGYEVLWARVIAIHTSSSILAFTTMLTVFLLGIALGSWIYSLWLDRPGWRAPLFIWGQFLIALYALVLLRLFHALPQWLYQSGYADPRAPEWRLAAGEVLLSMGIIFLPTLLMGAMFPALVRLVATSGALVGRGLGGVYSVNTIGAVIGAALTGMVFLPAIGLQQANHILSLLNMGIGLVAAWVLLRRRAVAVPVYVAMGVVAGLASSRALADVRHIKEMFRQDVARGGSSVLFYRDGPSGTVSVLSSTAAGQEYRRLFVDSQPVASTYPEAVADAKMLAHLPLLLHPHPRLALTVGLGSGGTSYSMSCHQIQVHCVEIEPVVLEAAKGYFDVNNHNVFQNPNYRVLLDDARNYLHVTDRRYDVISTDCTNLQYKSNGSLYTVEYFHLLRSRLAEGGIAAAWIPGEFIKTRELRTVIASFADAFPHVSIWYIPTRLTSFFILIGTPGPLQIDLQRLETGMRPKAVADDLAVVGIDSPQRFLAALLLGPRGAADFVAGVPLHTDDRPILEYRTARAVQHRTLGGNLNALLAYDEPIEQYLRPPVDPQALADIRRIRDWGRNVTLAHALRHEGQYQLARKHYAQAAALDPQDRLAPLWWRQMKLTSP